MDLREVIGLYSSKEAQKNGQGRENQLVSRSDEKVLIPVYNVLKNAHKSHSSSLRCHSSGKRLILYIKKNFTFSRGF